MLVALLSIIPVSDNVIGHTSLSSYGHKKFSDVSYMYMSLSIFMSMTLSVPWSQRFSFVAKRLDKREKEAVRENLW